MMSFSCSRRKRTRLPGSGSSLLSIYFNDSPNARPCAQKMTSADSVFAHWRPRRLIYERAAQGQLQGGHQEPLQYPWTLRQLGRRAVLLPAQAQYMHVELIQL